jgi:hypothetical protein
MQLAAQFGISKNTRETLAILLGAAKRETE